jgi:hypothetical protein
MIITKLEADDAVSRNHSAVSRHAAEPVHRQGEAMRQKSNIPSTNCMKIPSNDCQCFMIIW